jgi:homoserine O-acetyltransferase
MGGMAVLEWPLCTPNGYVRHIIPIATSARHSAWCISWGEAQRQSIYSDPAYADGYYTSSSAPNTGLAAARMAALLTYRSRDSFENRFGRKPQRFASNNSEELELTPLDSPPTDVHVAFHNEGHRLSQQSTSAGTPAPSIYSAQSYLRYQGDKFTARFDANCYIHITRKMDTHDLTRGRSEGLDESAALARILSTLPPGALIIGIETDGLFTPSEQHELAEYIPGAQLIIIPSPDGHDGFLLEFEQINRHVLGFLKARMPEIYEGRGTDVSEQGISFEVTRTSTFGEAEVDVTMW